MKIHLAESSYWDELGSDFQKEYVAALTSAYVAAAKLLPFGSPHMNFFIQPREYALIEETHDAARTYNSEFIEFAFDPKYYTRQSMDVVRNNVQRAVFHEMNHAARFNLGIFHSSLTENCILEGLATVFEREYANATPLWAEYPDRAAEWLAEIQDNEATLNFSEYLYEHPDGRKWIGYKVGTYMIDRAMQETGKTVIELTQIGNAEILKIIGANT